MAEDLVHLLIENDYEFHTRSLGSSGRCWCIGSKRTEWDYGERQARTFCALSNGLHGVKEVHFRFSVSKSALACGWVQELIGNNEKFLLEGGLSNLTQLLMADDTVEGRCEEIELHSRSPKDSYFIDLDDVLEEEIERVYFAVLNILKRNTYKGIKRTGKNSLKDMVCTSDVVLDRTLVSLGESGFVKGALSDQMKITPAGENELKALKEKQAGAEMVVTQQEEKNHGDMEYDVFISHASEDKDSFVRELAQELVKYGVSVWYDEFSLRLGSSLRTEIDKGLANSTYGIVILSHNFFSKDWPKLELNALFSLMKPGESKLLPIWHEITKEELEKYSPMVSDIVAARSSEGLDMVVGKIIEVVKG